MISEDRKAKLKWHCRRGMLELDLIFARFFNESIDLMTSHQVDSFEKLLQHPDPDLYAWLMGYEEPEDHDCAQIIAFIRARDCH